MKQNRKLLSLLTALLLLIALVSCKGHDQTDQTSTSDGTTAHTHNYIEEVFPPTCSAEGFTIHTCLSCDDYYKDTPTAKLPHSYTDEVVAPTCSAEGYTRHTCAVCGDTVTDTPTAQLTHVYYEEIVPPGCTVEGYTKHICFLCRESYTDTPTPAAGHHYLPEIIPPTGTEKGYTEHTCAVCGDSYRDTYTDPIQSLIIVTFDANGGTMEGKPVRLYNTGEHAELPVPTMEGFAFDGWYYVKNGEDVRVESGIWSIAEDIRLTASWSRLSVPIKLTMDMGGDKLPFNNLFAVWGDPIGILPTPTPQFGYLFEGWYEGDTPIRADTVSAYTDTVHLTARFRAPLESGTFAVSEQNTFDWAIDAEGTLRFRKTQEEITKISIPENAFAGNTNIRAVVFPSDVTLKDIGSGAFAGCINLKSINLPGSIGVIRSSVLAGCSALTDITVGSGISVINEDSFADCTSLTTLTLPLSLYQIYSPFAGCSALREIRYEGSEFQWSVIVKDAPAQAVLSNPALLYTYEVPLP